MSVTDDLAHEGTLWSLNSPFNIHVCGPEHHRWIVVINHSFCQLATILLSHFSKPCKHWNCSCLIRDPWCKLTFLLLSWTESWHNGRDWCWRQPCVSPYGEFPRVPLPLPWAHYECHAHQLLARTPCAPITTKSLTMHWILGAESSSTPFLTLCPWL